MPRCIYRLTNASVHVIIDALKSALHFSLYNEKAPQTFNCEVLYLYFLNEITTYFDSHIFRCD